MAEFVVLFEVVKRWMIRARKDRRQSRRVVPEMRERVFGFLRVSRQECGGDLRAWFGKGMMLGFEPLLLSTQTVIFLRLKTGFCWTMTFHVFHGWRACWRACWRGFSVAILGFMEKKVFLLSRFFAIVNMRIDVVCVGCLFLRFLLSFFRALQVLLVVCW